MTGAELERRLAERTSDADRDGVVVVDVRSRGEFDRGHITGAVHIPFWFAPFRSAQVPRTRGPVVVYCELGPRAWLAGMWWRRHGVARLEYLDGHMAGWRRDRRAVEGVPAAAP
jgi:rhodanese-related sulfurtransferase